MLLIMNKAVHAKSTCTLFLTSENWFEDFSLCKYQLVHLTINDQNLSVINIFMLASSRLRSKGVLIVRFRDLSFFSGSSFVSMARAFSFENLTSSNNYSGQMIFRFDRRETKLGYQMQQASTVSDGCIALFSAVFGSVISKEFWHWKYPVDKDVFSFAAIKDNRVVAHYGFCNRSLMYNNTALLGAQACDVMVSSRERGALSNSIFNELFRLGERVFYSENSAISVAYGFPHGRHYKLGARLKLYSPVSAISQATFDIPNSNVHKNLHKVNVLNSIGIQTVNKKHLNALLQVMTSSRDTVVLNRDYLYLLGRYAHHPEYNYDIYELEECYFVLKVEGSQIFLMDYIGALDRFMNNIDHFIFLLSYQYSGKRLHLWCLERVANEIAEFQFSTTKKVIGTGAMFVIRTYSEANSDFKQWWISMGDAEFL